ncbi:acyltransferase family protein [Rugamonas sp. CCM 8940]|uniref:acyltransferase family protein n=1 Tax=Rugamonas sp. CCM 8940 TaxID=2765359 RepID=UPI0018F2BC27|nr:acyltransferase [Rugamonas sp. CCM 8940]MBJ7308744.1 acyltransferase [Rugamonas sp. CCM 8940]
MTTSTNSKPLPHASTQATAVPLQNQTKIEELESIRGMAALLIVFFHFPKWNPLFDIGIINNGYLMVELFFVLSGYVIFSAYGEKLYSTKDLLRFQFLRFGRLYFVHLTFLMIFLAIEISKYIASTKMGGPSIRTVPFSENSLTAFVQQIFLAQALGPTGNALSFNGQAWSISVEFYTYLLFALIIFLCRKVKFQVFSALIVMSLLLLATKSTYGFEGVLKCLAGFFIGCVTAHLTKKSTLALPSYFSAIIFAAIALFLQFKPFQKFDIAIYFLTAALIASIVLAPKGLLNTVLKQRVLVWLGVISYSVYMSHSFVLWVTANVFKRVFKRPEVRALDGSWVLSLSALEAVAALAFTLVLVLAISQLTYRFIEQPTRAKSRRFAFARFN